MADESLVLLDDPGAGMALLHQPARVISESRFLLRVWNGAQTTQIVLTDDQAAELYNWLARRTERA